MSTAAPSMENIEQRRLQLEETVAMLSKTLEHWSTWEVEYAMLKEELEKADSPSPAEMIEIGRDVNGRLVNEKEVLELLGKDINSNRTANQVVDMIARRIDYVQQNRETVEKQLDKAEKQLAGFEILADPGLENEEGLPMMDIEEELDADGEVVKSSLTQPGKVAPELMEALRKAGLHQDEQGKSAPKASSKKSALSSSSASKSPLPASKPTPTAGASKSKKKSSLSETKIEPKVSKSPRKKSVAFADDVEVKTFEKPSALKEDLKGWNLKPGSRVYELEDDEETFTKHVIPVDENADEAQLRRDMINYGLEEAGQVVAEMDLGNLDEFDDDDDDEDYDSDEDEDEDEHGRSTRPIVTEEYRQQMMELENKLNARMVENVGPRPDLHPLADVADDVRSLRIRDDEEFDKSIGPSEPDAKKKDVRFAETADESETAGVPAKPSGPPVPTISDTIVERTGPAPQAPSAPSKPAKVSRFKSNMNSASQPSQMLPTPPVPEPPPAPTGPQGQTLANTVIEHTPQSSEPQAPDDHDPIQLNREIHTEYHKMRNKMIQEQGGFKETEEEKDSPLMEERDGKPKKVSRFMAARLKAEGL
ncbi:hypothetical protein P280DRAFT_473733 [Massarina eburnea CBS 473.64]|uniref:DUF3835 domain-containing protein n=1 Tax=Massarina eburnea CBS 473.64 TaxID=1395130 RepID=A0A6A6RKX8_9PLEO|nr:hypothetical protein P280DRAFT_473733 [Massarina eburnea CBS 473.64]